MPGRRMPFSPSTMLVSVGLLAIPALIWFELHESETWNARLVIPELIEQPARHTPQHVEGIYLPPVIKNNTVFSSDQSPLHLTGITHISPDTIITIPAGTTLLVSEHAQLVVEGTLTIAGEPTAPVRFATNEAHPLNQTWGGIIFLSGSTGIITHAHIQHSSPAISCLAGSNVDIAHTTITGGSMGVFTSSQHCTLIASTIQGVRDGVVAINTHVSLEQTTITAKEHDVVERVY